MTTLAGLSLDWKTANASGRRADDGGREGPHLTKKGARAGAEAGGGGWGLTGSLKEILKKHRKNCECYPGHFLNFK